MSPFVEPIERPELDLVVTAPLNLTGVVHGWDDAFHPDHDMPLS